MSEKGWSDFPIGYPPPKAGSNRDCAPLINVAHIAHVTDGIRIIEDRRIRSSLVYDESCLNTKRTQVAWVSPKDWANGYIYGNVAFWFDWEDLVANAKIYWVEHRATGKQDICRFLISQEEFKDHDLAEYDYSKAHGPLYLHAEWNKWFHNDAITSEYMIFRDLPLRKCNRITFVQHHSSYCNKSGSSCQDLGLGAHEGGAEVLGSLIGAGNTSISKKFESDTDPGEVHHSVRSAVNTLYRRTVAKFEESACGSLEKADRREIMRTAICAAGKAQQNRVKALLKLFPSKEKAESAFNYCIKEFFGGLTVRD